jgi:prepilin-type N-terminal cleavage/methylation domain-containing protein
MTRALSREDGFTMPELLVSMSISLILVFAALVSLDTFNSGAADSTRRIIGEDAARTSVNRIVGLLRNAGVPSPLAGGAQPTTIDRLLANDLVFRSSAWPGESGVGVTGSHVIRMCLDTAARTLWRDGLRFGTAGPSDPGAACPSVATGWTHVPIATNVVNSAAQPLFRYGSTTPVRTIGISLRLESGSKAVSRPIVLHSGGVLRGRSRPR